MHANHQGELRPSASPASAAASRQSLLAGLANLQEHNQRLRRQNHRLAACLSEVLGTEVFRESGIGHPGETGQLRSRVTELEQLIRDLRQQLEERSGELGAARAANRDLIARQQPETGQARIVHYSCRRARRVTRGRLTWGNEQANTTCSICTPRELLTCAARNQRGVS
jgi:chromosome segregation ATPase